MVIRRDELRKTDFSDVSSGKRLAPVHPGNVLLKDFIEPMGISRYCVAKNTNVPQRHSVPATSERNNQRLSG